MSTQHWVFLLVLVKESGTILYIRTGQKTAWWPSRTVGSGTQKVVCHPPSLVKYWSTNQEDKSPPIVCLGGLEAKVYLLAFLTSDSPWEGELALVVWVEEDMKWADWFLGWEVWFARAGKKNSLRPLVTFLVFEIQEFHNFLCCRVTCLCFHMFVVSGHLYRPLLLSQS